MRDQGTGGSIVNTVSAAQMGNFGQTNYSAREGRDRVDDLHLGRSSWRATGSA